MEREQREKVSWGGITDCGLHATDTSRHLTAWCTVQYGPTVAQQVRNSGSFTV